MPTLILGACASSVDPLLKIRGAQELPFEEMWRDFTCVKVLLLANYEIFLNALYFPQCPSSAACAFVRGVCVCERERERERVLRAETSIFVHLHTCSFFRSFYAVSQVSVLIH